MAKRCAASRSEVVKTDVTEPHALREEAAGHQRGVERFAGGGESEDDLDGHAPRRVDADQLVDPACRPLGSGALGEGDACVADALDGALVGVRGGCFEPDEGGVVRRPFLDQ